MLRRRLKVCIRCSCPRVDLERPCETFFVRVVYAILWLLLYSVFCSRRTESSAVDLGESPRICSKQYPGCAMHMTTTATAHILCINSVSVVRQIFRGDQRTLTRKQESHFMIPTIYSWLLILLTFSAHHSIISKDRTPH